MTTQKLPSAKDWAAQWSDELAKMLSSYAREVLEAAAQDVQERGMKEAATVIRRRKAEV